jgi:molybdate transport system substrate-binding protein
MRAFHVVLVALLLPPGCGRPPAGNTAAGLHVAAAANLTNAFAEIGKAFASQSGTRVIYSFGATSQLTQQIENGAPFDVFAAADVEHVDELVRRGLVLPETRAVYARGVLTLWIPNGAAAIGSVEDLTRPQVKTVAIAKPELAPYGKAAVETLQSLNLWNAVQPKVVYAQNILMAKQYAASGNADAAFTALSLVTGGTGRAIQVDEHLHKPIDQAIGVVRNSHEVERGRAYVRFVLGREGQGIMNRFGYRSPSK